MNWDKVEIISKWEEADPSIPMEEMAALRREIETRLREDSSDWMLLEAEVRLLVLMDQGDLAERLIEEYLSVYPGHSDASARLGWLHWKAGNTDEAVAEWKATIARDPLCASAYAFMIEALHGTGDPSAALQAAHAAIEKFPTHRGLVLKAAKIFDAAHKHEESIKVLTNYLEIAPEDIDALCAIARASSSNGKSTEGWLYIAPYIERQPAIAEILIVAMELAATMKKMPCAIEMLGNAIKASHGRSDRFYSQLIINGNFRIGQRETTTVILKLAEEGTAPDPLLVEFLEHLGSRNDKESAAILFTHLTQHSSVYTRSIARFFSTFHYLHPTKNALQTWVAQRTELIQSHTWIWGGVGAWLLATGNAKGAADHLITWQSRSDIRPWMVLLLGRALEQLGFMDEANAHYREALVLPPDHSEMGIRSRLAYNIAMEGMASAGLLILRESSSRNRHFSTNADLIRTTIVECLSALARNPNPEIFVELKEEAMTSITDLAGKTPPDDIKAIIAQFRQRLMEIQIQITQDE